MAYSCDGFDAINTNPDAATTATPGMLATGQLREALRTGGKYDAKWFFGDMFFTKMISWQEAAEDSRKVQYNQITTTGFSVYKDLTNCLKMVELAADIDKDAYEGLALFIKAFRLYDTTMALGDIPYSEAMKGEEGNTRPKYDTQKEVILQMLDDLDAAYTHFSNATRNFDGDIVYGGDPAKWKRAVSALQLRILLNLSKKEQDTELNVRQRFSSVVAKQELFESNDDNFQFVYGTLSSQLYPLYLSRFNSYAGVSVTIVDVLKKYRDNRLFFYCEPTKAQTAAGVPDSEWDAYQGIDPSRIYSEIMHFRKYLQHQFPLLGNRNLPAHHPVGIRRVELRPGRSLPQGMDRRRCQPILPCGDRSQHEVRGRIHACRIPARAGNNRRLYPILPGKTGIAVGQKSRYVRKGPGRGADTKISGPVHAQYLHLLLRLPQDRLPRAACQPAIEHEHETGPDAAKMAI